MDMDTRGGCTIGDWIIEFFSSWGWLGMLLALYFLSILDSVAMPVLPDIFAVLIFLGDVSWDWGLMVLAVALLGDITGDSLLYIFVKKVRVPGFIQKISKKYVEFFLVSDERLILLNRIAPVMPFTGAFIAMLDWDYKKSMFYIFIGGIVKYGALFLMVGAFNVAWTKDTAQLVSIIMVLAMVGISMAASYLYRKNKMKPRAGESGEGDNFASSGRKVNFRDA